MDIKDILKLEFDEALEELCKGKGDLDRRKKFENFDKQYNLDHAILKKKKKKIITQEQNSRQYKYLDVAKLTVPLQRKIVNFASGFLFGEPVQYMLNDEAYKEVYDDMDRIFRENKINYFNRKLARIVMSETQAAEYWYPVKREGKNTLRVALWANSMGDDLYPHYDATGDMDAFTRRYTTHESKDKVLMHADVYTANRTYLATRMPEQADWDIVEEDNPVGKIRIVWFEKEHPEWHHVQALIERVEWLISSHADVNDYYGDPIVKVFGDYEGGIKKAEDGKAMFFTSQTVDSSGKPVYGDAEYMTWESMPESKKMELENLLNMIHSMTSTPDLSFQSVKGIGNISGITIRMMMMDAYLKSLLNQEIFGEGLVRRFNLLKKMMITTKMFEGDYGDLNIADMEAEVSFQDPLPVDYTEMVEALTIATGGEKILSQETGTRLNPFVDDGEAEIEKLEEDKKEAEAKQTFEPVENFINEQP